MQQDERTIVQKFLQSYKTELCKKHELHDLRQCFYFHTRRDQRRKPWRDVGGHLTYISRLCQQYECEEGMHCNLCHNNYELQYHPHRYKTKACDQIDKCGLLNQICPSIHPSEICGEGFIRLQLFKVIQCESEIPHQPKRCPFWHNPKDRRRNPKYHEYSYFECQNKNHCPLLDRCDEAHNKIEQLYHPARYKSKFCDQSDCKYGEFCSFAHSEKQLTVELIDKLQRNADFYNYKYKVVWCPNISKHDQSQCVYAHNPQDWRRDPNIYHYEPKNCPNWNTESSLTSYKQGGCPQSIECKFCHGRKQLEYHPSRVHKKLKKSFKPKQQYIPWKNQQINLIKKDYRKQCVMGIGAPFFQSSISKKNIFNRGKSFGGSQTDKREDKLQNKFDTYSRRSEKATKSNNKIEFSEFGLSSEQKDQDCDSRDYDSINADISMITKQ